MNAIFQCHPQTIVTLIQKNHIASVISHSMNMSCKAATENFSIWAMALFYMNFKLFVPCIFSTWNENQLMSLFYSYIAGSLHVSGPQAHLQESSCSCSHNHWFSICAALFACSVCCEHIQSTWTEWHRYWTNGCVNSCTNSPEDGPVGPKHVEIQQYTNKIVTSVGFHSICSTWSKHTPFLLL